ncbi:MAG: hypothetical protein OXI24_03245 [Candidatus Poribacteria bacterium]|nr:hypothetical protein [Candidatus Poribacteria bacterium]
MKQFFALYVKELKANKALFLFLLLLIVGMNVYGFIEIENISQQVASGEFLKLAFFIFLPPFTLVLSLPFLLAHAFNTEWRSETYYQMFALPVPQYIVNLAKVAAVASKGIVGGGIVIGGMYFWVLADLPDVQIIAFDNTQVTGFLNFVFITGLALVTYMVFILGVVTGMEGVKFSVKQYRGLTAVVFFAIAVFLFFRFFNQMTIALNFLGQISITPTPSGQIELAPFVYTILMGVVFMIIGLVVYEKRAEI